MLAGQSLLVVVLVIVSSVAPGFFFISKLRWSPLEKLCGSIGLSLLLIYLATFALYCVHADFQWCWLLTGASVVLGLLRARALWRVLHCRQVRQPLLGFGFLLVWTLTLAALVRHYSGGGWAADWAEHFHRTMFFLKHLPTETVIYPFYQLPARPPMMNILAACFLGQTELRFELFQIVFAILNLLVLFPCCLIGPALVKRGGSSLVILIGALAMNPMFIQNLTYTWTKLLAAFYVVLGLCFYLAGWRKRDATRTTAAFASFSAAALVHYSAAPYIICVLAHYSVRLLRDVKAHWREAVAASLVSIAILGTWFAWSIGVYGVRTTFASTTTMTALQPTYGSQVMTTALNMVDTLVPHVLRNDAELRNLIQASTAGYLRDCVFLIYQTNLIAAMGAVGGLIVIYLLARGGAGGPAGRRPEWWFWVFVTVGCTALGVAVVSMRDTFGVAHVTLQPIVLLGVTLLAFSFRRIPKLLRWTVVAGCALDFAVGIFLHKHVENFALDLTRPQHGVFHIAEVHEADGQRIATLDTDLSQTALANLIAKYTLGPMFGREPPQYIEFLGDHAAGMSGVLHGLVLVLAALTLSAMAREAARPELDHVHWPDVGLPPPSA